MILPRDRSVLVVVDIQERLIPTIVDGDRLVAQASRLIRAAELLDVPVIVTEQYPKGLGPTDPRIVGACTTFRPIEKASFSACGEPSFIAAIRSTDANHVVIVGIETHVCIAQTALDLVGRGYTVHIALDAIGAGNDVGGHAGRARMAAAGVIATTFEASVFDWMADARHPRFKEVQELVKSARKERA